MTLERPDVEKELSGLKDFQRDTVEYVFDRFWGVDPVRRFLVADEVGLGKTMVARGVVAKTIDLLWDDQNVDRIDVVYICSNNQIAGQNLKKLRVGAVDDIQHADRLTMLPKAIGGMEGRKVNFVSFTPGTSFDLKGSGGGRAAERVLIYRMLQDGLGDSRLSANRWLRFFEGGTRTANFKARLKWFDAHERKSIPLDMVQEFATTVRSATYEGRPLLEALHECADEFLYLRKGKSVAHAPSSRRYRLIGELRHLIARASVAKLEPDLVILDEFQRFKSLMNAEDEASELAHELFNYHQARLLLLSATPYKMYTLPDEAEGEDHYEDFRNTVEFLAGKDRADVVSARLAEMRTALYAGELAVARDAKDVAQRELRRVMVRTERLASTPDRDGMIVGKDLPGVAVRPCDVRAYASDAAVAKVLHSHDILEYWRSAPYLLEFMDTYKIKKDLEAAVEAGNPELAAALSLGGDRLSWQDLRHYAALDPGNAKMRGLVSDVLDRGAWKLAWIPPSLPYYELAGDYADAALRSFTKRLVFSSWTVVPKAIGAVLSYEAERRLMDASPTSSRAYDAPRQTALLTFQLSDGRLTGMPVLGMMFPSAALAEAGDPVGVAQELEATFPMSPEEYRSAVRARVEGLTTSLPEGPQEGAVDASWYWAAPILLDIRRNAHLSPDRLSWGFADTDDDDGSSSRFYDHLTAAAAVHPTELKRRPEDLIEVLTDLAIAGPGVVALRALSRGLGVSRGLEDADLRDKASIIAWSFRGLFNRPEIMSVVRRGATTDYWRAVLKHAVQGGLQSVVDEFVHVLVESEGLVGKPHDEQALSLAVAIDDALSLRSSSSSIHFFEAEAGTLSVDRSRHLRNHFAVRFGRGTSEDSQTVQRESQVRAAYNSPFWPFVLASTSVGQEGLDFHQYSHAIVHWNLPGNPVDLEQREGRVHRYKGHAVRKNIARKHGSDPEVAQSADPWSSAFDVATGDRPDGLSEVFPYWIYPGDFAIERYAPVMPLSKESHALQRLMRTVAAYRLVVGQPRQEDLLRYLGDEAVDLAGLTMDLSPPIRAKVTPVSSHPETPQRGPRPDREPIGQPSEARTPSSTELAIQRDVRTYPWSSASEVAKRVNLGVGTVRRYLHQVHHLGIIEWSAGDNARHPVGGHVSRYRWLEVPRNEPEPTELMLCDSCASELYGDPRRYHWSRTEAVWQREQSLIDALGDNDPAPPCDRCGRPTDNY